MPLRSINLSRAAGDVWRRMASISAEYCLFWLTMASFFWIRCRSQGINAVSLHSDSTTDVLDDRFSSTPEVCQLQMGRTTGGSVLRT